MLIPQFTDGAFVDAEAFNAAAANTTSSLSEIGGYLHTPGIVNPSALSPSTAGMVATVAATSSFRALFGAGPVAGAYGVTDGATSGTYAVSLASVVPASGSQLVYLVASYSTIQQGATSMATGRRPLSVTSVYAVTSKYYD